LQGSADRAVLTQDVQPPRVWSFQGATQNYHYPAGFTEVEDPRVPVWEIQGFGEHSRVNAQEIQFTIRTHEATEGTPSLFTMNSM
jgi:hypothetical protein